MRQYNRLRSIDGLTPVERDYRFDNMILTDDNRDARDAMLYALARKRGIISLFGKPGRGKTRLMIATVNEAREAGIPAVYDRMGNILDYLRDAYNPNRNKELTADERWELLCTVDVLAIDELDQFKGTEWAMEKFLALIDERWRNMDRRITLLASNAALARLPDKVASRLQDRRAQFFKIEGPDMRQFNTWQNGEHQP